MTEEEKCECPLCGKQAKETLIDERRDLWRIDCPERCTTYKITRSLINKLSEDAGVKDRARYLSDAARRATHYTGRNAFELALTLDEANYLAVAANEQGLQDAVQPLVDYLSGKGIEVMGKYSHSFEYLEVSLGNGRTATLKVERSVLFERSPNEIKTFLEDHSIAERLRKDGSFELNKGSIPR